MKQPSRLQYFLFKLYERITFRWTRYFVRPYRLWKVMNTIGGAKAGLKVNGECVLTPNTFLGENVNLNGMCIKGNGKVVIGNNFHSGTGCSMITSYHNYEGAKIPYDSTFITKDVIIEDNVWIGDDVIILGGATIGEGAIIQAGSIVVSSIPKYGIAGGHPAKVFKTRDVAHYEALKVAKLFH